MVGAMSLTWWNWPRIAASGLMPARPGDRHRVAGAAEVGGDQLGVLEGRVAGPRPAGVVHVVGLRRAQRVQAAERLERGQLLLDGVRNPVLGQQFADAAVLAFGAGAVVAEDVDDDGVVARCPGGPVRRGLADLDVDVLDEAGEHLHQSPLERPLLLGNVRPARHASRRAASVRRRRGSSRWPSAGRRPVRGRRPSRRRTCPCTCRPTPWRHGAARAPAPGAQYMKNGLVGRERPVLAQPGDGLVGQVLGQVVALVAAAARPG